MIGGDKIKSEIDERRNKIVSLLLTLMLVTVYFALIIYFIYFSNPTLRNENITKDPTKYILYATCIVVLAITVSILRFYLLHKNVRLTLLIINSITLVPAFINLLYSGTASPAPYIILAIVILSSNIVLGSKHSYKIYAAIAFIIISIAFLHLKGIFHYEPGSTATTISETTAYTLLLGIITYIAKISYDQIEHSYEKAFSYASRLERLNKRLDEKVRLRTQQLESSFEAQANSIHAAAVLGRITQPLLHDLTTCISSLKGSLELLTLDSKKFSHREVKLLDLMQAATKQMTQVIASSRDMMTDSEKLNSFDPSNSILNIINIVQSEILRHEIDVIYNFATHIYVQGSPSLFERIITNILMNAIEELSTFEGQRKIDISTELQAKHYCIFIKDSGRGIPEKIIEKIFDSDYSTKSDRGHLGIGLAFVKSVMEKHFKGSIRVESEVGKYTRFILTFNVSEQNQ